MHLSADMRMWHLVLRLSTLVLVASSLGMVVWWILTGALTHTQCPNPMQIYNRESVSTREYNSLGAFRKPTFPIHLCKPLPPSTKKFPVGPPTCTVSKKSPNQLECSFPLTDVAVVVPFSSGDLGLLANALRLWTREAYFPCDRTQNLRKHVDLVFQFTRSLDQFPNLYSDIRDALGEARQCFRDILFFSMNLDVAQDQYPGRLCFSPGPSTMFHSLFGLEELLRRYSHFFMLEADVRATRSFWVDQLMREVTLERLRFWQKGSIAYNDLSGNLHVNGNGIFRLGDEEFNCFMQQELAIFYPLNFDSSVHSMSTFFRPAVRDKFQFTRYLMNIAYKYRDGFEDPFQDSYFLHGKDASYAIDQRNVQYLSSFTCPRTAP